VNEVECVAFSQRQQRQEDSTNRGAQFITIIVILMNRGDEFIIVSRDANNTMEERFYFSYLSYRAIP
jgi:hypothetical protein